jgi:hypothetical protein
MIPPFIPAGIALRAARGILLGSLAAMLGQSWISKIKAQKENQSDGN